MQPPENLQTDNSTVQQILLPVWKRLNTRNEHFVHTIVGREGIGKSHTAIKLARQIDRDFSAENVFFNPAELLRYLRDDKYTEGEVLILDEAGVGLGKRTWQESGQKRMNQALQLIRNHNVGLLFTLPRLSELDSQAKGRLHSYYEVREKRAERFVIGEWRWLDPDRVDITGEVYRRTPQYDNTQLKRIKFTPPDATDVVAAYEDKKETFQQQFYDETIAALEGSDDDATDEMGPHDIADEIRQNGGAEHYLEVINNGAQAFIDTDRIELDYEIGEKRAKRVKKLLRDDVDRDVL
jgi:hypothetical protein